MNLESIDWNALERLRKAFIGGTAGNHAYWSTVSDLASYDATFAERIGWKWDAVLAELGRLGWSPPQGPLYDFGCGSGIAGRRMLANWGSQIFTALKVSDRSPLAEDFAQTKARSEHPQLEVGRFLPGIDLPGESTQATLVISHVLNELNPASRQELLRWMPRFTTVVWVEPGTHADSRALIEMREALLPHFRVVAPCTHCAACGLRTTGREGDWCHFFGTPAGGIFADGNWVRFGQRMGIDLRSVPYSYLVLDRRSEAVSADSISEEIPVARLLGEPRMYKGYAKLFRCSVEGVDEVVLQKRTDSQLFKRLERGRHFGRFAIQAEKDRVTSITEVTPKAGIAPEEGEGSQLV